MSQKYKKMCEMMLLCNISLTLTRRQDVCENCPVYVLHTIIARLSHITESGSINSNHHVNVNDLNCKITFKND